MQNILKVSGKVTLLACLSLMLLTGCSRKSKLKMAIEVANKQCPMDMGAVGEISSITFDGEHVKYTVSMNETYLNMEALEKNPDAMKSTIIAMFGNPEENVKQMLRLVIDANSGIKFLYKGKDSGKEVECSLNTQELTDILNTDLSAEENDMKKLEEQVKVTNVSCPMKVDGATTLDKLTIEADRVLYHYTITEEVMDIAILQENAEQLKQNVGKSLNASEPALRMFLEACINCGRGVGYKYTGDTSGESLEIFFDVAEVKAML